MLKKFFIITLCFFAQGLHAFEITDSCEGGYVSVREDSLRWSIKEKKECETLLDRICFNSIEMVEWGIKSHATLCEDYALKANIDYALPYNRAHSYAYDVSVGAGYHFFPCDRSWRFTPYAGFSLERQSYQTCQVSGFIDPFADYDVSLRTHWYGPWVGFDASYALCCGWSLYGSFAYQFTWLKGHLDAECGYYSHVLEDCFKQRGFGYGVDLSWGLQYALCDQWLLDVSTCFRLRHLLHGHQHGYHREGEEDLEESSEEEKLRHRLRNVEWRSAKLSVALVYRF